MNTHEVHYHVHEQELLAVRDALLKFRCYLLGGAAGFTVITNHDTLRHLFFRQRDLSTRHVRRLQVLAPYQRQIMNIVYKKGAFNHADALLADLT
jgi:hypothetical protein